MTRSLKMSLASNHLQYCHLLDSGCHKPQFITESKYFKEIIGVLTCNMLYLYFSISFSVYYVVIIWFSVVVKMLQVLCGWRWWVTEQHIKQELAAGAAQVDRDEPLMEDLKSCLTYAAHMKDLTAGPTEDSQEQVSTSGISQFKEIMVKNTFTIIRCPAH